MGIDINHKYDRKVRRTAPKSQDVYLRLLVKLYRYLARRTGAKFNKIVLNRLFMSRINRPPLSLAKLVRHMKKPGREGLTAVVVGTVTDDSRIVNLGSNKEFPKLSLCALRVTEKARARVLKAGALMSFSVESFVNIADVCVKCKSAKVKINIKSRISDDQLDLSMSDLDEVPIKEIAALRKIHSLDLSNNRLTSLPSAFASLTFLTKLHLSENGLTELPEDFGSLCKLRYLDLYKNKLERLPLSFSQLVGLKFLDLKDNPLIPTIAKVAGPCVDNKGCQQCAKDVVHFFKQLEQEVESRKQVRQKLLEINQQEKQAEKKRLKKERQSKTAIKEVQVVKNSTAAEVPQLVPANSKKPLKSLAGSAKSPLFSWWFKNRHKMSHKYYDEQFCEIQDCLVATLNSEPAQADRRENRQLLAGLYVRYITIANKLGTCVDQMVQPQKRLLLRKLLEATLGRILELKTDLVEADLSEWTHCGDILEDLRITPNDSELEIPACFRREREQEINCRKGVIDDVLNKLGFTDEVDERLPMSEQQAILVIQTHERARQGRLRAQFMKEIRSMKDKNKPVVTGMIPPPKKRNEEIEKDLENQERRRQLQIQRQEEYSQDIKKIRSHLEKTQSLIDPDRKEEYEEWWRNKDESSNPRQHHYKHIIEHEQMTEMENELRKVVDEMMKAELMLLQDAFDKDRGHKSKKKSSKKSRKAMKKGKKKKEKDLTPDRTTQSLFEELVANGIIKRYPEVWMQDFRGERSFHPPAAHNRGKEPPFDLGDIRQVLTEYCVVPLLSARLHRNTPHIKSVLLAGPKGSGKDMLLHAICNEIGAVLFDLTPANIVGKYPGKSGLIMLIHLVVKVSRLLQPSVIYMDNAERPFVKKVPKTDRTDPKRLKKDLPKMVKNFGTEDRVILIGATNCPWESDQKLLQQVYQKFLIIPRPKYSSRYASSRILEAFGRDTPNDRIKYAIWTHLLNRHMPVSWKFDTSVVSKISDGYTVGSIVSTVKEVITVKRMLQLRIHPLSPLELVNALCKRTPVYKEANLEVKDYNRSTSRTKKGDSVKKQSVKSLTAGNGKKATGKAGKEATEENQTNTQSLDVSNRKQPKG
ncbi:hypothetical protein D910_11638 [Dendroctonus ponderosae]|uniref:ATPase AAA-type core domain-containing protein n=1 Tax=Dendroctonus ponderosae TaxID=77166 RepID=U4UMM7_DENPD|nr:hypothetical protein D910_11638 [Dendroctonus ponderosae]